MSDLQTFLSMGGYAAYVWTSFGLAFAVLLANVIWSKRQLAKQQRRAKTFAEKRNQS